MAIARDANSYQFNAGAVSSISWTHTVTASPANPWLGVFVKNYTNGDPTISSVTANGVGMTHVDGFELDGFESENWVIGLYSLAAPPTGAVAMVANLASSNGGIGQFSAYGVSYTGVDQTTPIDSSSHGAEVNVTSHTDTTTVVNSNSWLIGGAMVDNTQTITAGSGTSG
jgi:hypothetical protein